MAVFGYARVSTAEQAADDRASLAEQERRIRGAAMMLEGKIGETTPQMVRDEGVSGSVPLKKRKHGGPLMAQLQAGDWLIAAKLDRLFRSAEDALVVARELQERKVHLILVDLGSDPVTGNGISKLFFTLLAAIAEFERTRVLERMNEGRAGKAKRGGHIGGDAPYGYRVEGAGKAARLVEDHRAEGCRQDLQAPRGWRSVSVGLQGSNRSRDSQPGREAVRGDADSAHCKACSAQCGGRAMGISFHFSTARRRRPEPEYRLQMAEKGFIRKIINRPKCQHRAP
jgi:putative DNA-invertase from lambdoid prophage Rac